MNIPPSIPQVFYVPGPDKALWINTKRDQGYVIQRVQEVAESNMYRITVQYAHIDLAD